jgi:hypothetical protein
MNKSDEFDDNIHKQMVNKVSEALQAGWSKDHSEKSNMTHELEALTMVLAIRAKVMGVPLTTVISAVATIYNEVEVHDEPVH